MGTINGILMEVYAVVIFRCSEAGNSVVSGWIWLKLELIQAFIVVLVSCKNEDVPI